jgi:secreted trypsin-like serine protease
MKHVIHFLLACLFAAVTQDTVHAISREQDTVRDVTNLFKAPTILPPNNAVRPNLNGMRNGGPVLEPFQRDESPEEQSPTEKVSIGYYPWVVALAENNRTPQEGYVCAGVIVAPNWALTAAHCTYSWARRWPVDAEAYVLTETAALASPGPRFAVTKIIPHPDYDPRRLVNDLALVRFDTKGADVPQPIQLEGPPIEDQLGEIAQIVGWGVSNARLPDRRELELLQMIQVNVLSDKGCFNALRFPRLRGKGVFCARSLLHYHDTCYRFGGAPIVMRDLKGGRYLAGLVSWPAGCSSDALAGKPYLDIQAYVPWVKATIKENTQVAR